MRTLLVSLGVLFSCSAFAAEVIRIDLMPTGGIWESPNHGCVSKMAAIEKASGVYKNVKIIEARAIDEIGNSNSIGIFINNVEVINLYKEFVNGGIFVTTTFLYSEARAIAEEFNNVVDHLQIGPVVHEIELDFKKMTGWNDHAKSCWMIPHRLSQVIVVQ